MSSAAKKRAKRATPRGPSRSPVGILPEPSLALFPSKAELLKLVAIVAIAASVAVACNYAAALFNRRPKPFCDSGRDPLDPVPDFCERCPDHGQCHNGKLECLHGYKKHGRICIEDRMINQTAKKLAELLERIVCGSYARVLCGEAGKYWFQEEDIRKIIDEEMIKEFTGLKDDGLEFAKSKAMEFADSFLEARVIFNGNKEFKCPELLAELHKPLSCCIRQWIYRNIFLVVTVFVLLAGLLYFLWTMRQRRALSNRAEQLYQQVCEILEDTAMRIKMEKQEGESWVVASWLRDHLLLPRERKDTILWKKVEELILEDSRIDQYPKLIKGESKIVLEWQADGSLSSNIKRMGLVDKAKASGRTTISSDHGMRSVLGEPQVT
ncbi:uncharacterized protein LOC109707009 isoform X1 [Ananas comosus]|uniref:Uncharacterized protein LOC109707009 isoform X1 n=1 Tax=Ananas comosus TaxID=4615 RepID=A0A6P5EJJ4_ANACO|nr:uncharacterized protein LOC109707009 isoform X1 [Ananas comosus]